MRYAFKNPKYTLTNLLCFLIAASYALENTIFPNLLNFGALAGSGYPEHGEYYRLFTVIFLHANFAHILFNLYAFYILGNPIESYYGRKKYLSLIFLLTLLSSLVSWYYLAPNAVSIDASGMIFGLLGIALLRAKELGFSRNSIWFTLAINALVPLMDKSIDYHAHLGGLLAGLVLGYIYK